jgi:ABC-type Fe3+ transport system permease subunit
MGIGIGLRYQSYPYHNSAGEAQWVLFKHLDTSLMIGLVALLLCLGIGIAVAFLGLAYHHHRRHYEFLREHGRNAAERVRA